MAVVSGSRARYFAVDQFMGFSGNISPQFYVSADSLRALVFMNYSVTIAE
jgi:hypothetical protein